jgi:hypothetical protein
MSQSLPSVGLYIRITDAKGPRYERVNRRNPQIATGPKVYCLHSYANGRRRWPLRRIEQRDQSASGDRRCLPESRRNRSASWGVWGRRPPAKPANEVTTGSDATKPANPNPENLSTKGKQKQKRQNRPMRMR